MCVLSFDIFGILFRFKSLLFSFLCSFNGLLGILFSLFDFKLAKVLVGLRVSTDEESEGLDLASHGERGYNL